MNLKSLYVRRYKNLVDFAVNFEAGKGLSILVGNNGSGKSNLLEVISGIFHDLFISKTKRKIKSDNSLVYDLDGVECKLEQKDGSLRCYGPKRMGIRSFIENRALNNVIGLYSGEDDRLWTLFYQEYYEAYVRRIKSHRYQERMRLIFINKYYWNHALLTLLLSDNETLKPFIENDLGIKSVSKIELAFNFNNFAGANDLLTAFIDKINPDHTVRQEYTIDEIKERITRKIDHDEFGREVVKHVDVEDLDVFWLLTQACMPKVEKIIKDIIIMVNDGITVKQLSEGEKKLILVKTVLDILSDEKTLVLMDEPDAHLHEGRKSALVNVMRGYPDRQIVIATHSPVIAQLARDEELLMVESVNGRSALLSSEKREMIKRLTGSAWDAIGQEMIFQSTKPLVVFEGKIDVQYVRKALQVLQLTEPKFQNVNLDFISCGGADNAQYFIKDLFSVISPEKRVYMFFDRDNEGRKGAAALLGISENDEKIVKYHDISENSLTVSFIPYRYGLTSGDFLIEDYFSWDITVKKMVDQIIEAHHHPLKQLPSLSKQIKKKLDECYESLSSEEYVGFKALVEKLYSISEGITNG